MPVLSATDCITPAFRHTLRQMFQPFRFSFWWRIAIIGLFAGELGGGGGFSGNFPSSIPHGGTAGNRGSNVPWHMGWFTPAHILAIAAAIAIFVIVATLIFLYINSILRFVLFDAVLHGNARIVDGWRKWRETGRRFFAWQLLLVAASWSIVILVMGLPLLLLFGGHHIGFWHIDPLAIVVLVLAGLLTVLLTVALAIVAVIAKDFIVPMMALEGIGWQEGWQRFRAIAQGHASEYVIYFLMKIVLRIGAGIAHGIVVFVVVLILMVPAVIVLVAGIAIGVGSTTVVKAMLITLAIVGGLLLLAVIMIFSAFAGAPIAFFFPAYSIYFFAGRYEPLGRIVFPAPPAPPVPPPVWVPPMPEPPATPA